MPLIHGVTWYVSPEQADSQKQWSQAGKSIFSQGKQLHAATTKLPITIVVTQWQPRKIQVAFVPRLHWKGAVHCNAHCWQPSSGGENIIFCQQLMKCVMPLARQALAAQHEMVEQRPRNTTRFAHSCKRAWSLDPGQHNMDEVQLPALKRKGAAIRNIIQTERHQKSEDPVCMAPINGLEDCFKFQFYFKRILQRIL